MDYITTRLHNPLTSVSLASQRGFCSCPANTDMAASIETDRFFFDLMNSTMQHQPASTAANTAPDNVHNCVVCTRDQPSEAFPVTDCSRNSHDPNVCKRCFNKHIVGHINAGNTIIECAECSERLRYEDIQKIVSKTSLSKYDKVLTKAVIEDEADFHYCVSTSGLRETNMKKCHVPHLRIHC